MVVFEKCDKSKAAAGCKPDSEITDWMREKYIVLYENQKRFIQHKFDD